MGNIYSSIIKKKNEGRKQFAILIDPDKAPAEKLGLIIQNAVDAEIDYFFIGGSIITNGNIEYCIKLIKKKCNIPIILFPGNVLQINKYADAILLLSLISGRNPEMLIGRHVVAAPVLRSSGLEILSTGYMLVDGGNATSVSYMSNTIPIPSDKNDVAVCTALAGEMLGMKLLYMDAGSGARNRISDEMIAEVSKNISVPLILGGGIRSAESAWDCCKAGADIIVVGNAIEKDPELVKHISGVIHSNA